MNRKLRGLGILYVGEYEFVILEDKEGSGLPSGFFGSRNNFFCARRFGIAQDVAEFHSPAWTTVLGGGFVRWFPDEQFFDVEFPENTV